MSEGKTPANDPGAEAAVLGACMVEAEAARCALMALEEADFYSEVNRKVFRAIGQLAQAHDFQGIDVVTVGSRLREDNLLEEVGGMEYVAGLVKATITTAHTEHYCRIVRDEALSRRITVALRETYETESAESLAKLSELVMAKEGNASAKLYDFRTDIPATVEKILNPTERLYKTGFDGLDDLLGGIEATELITIGARTSGGKTAFMLRVALQMAMQEVEVLYITSEMRTKELVKRILPQATDVYAWKFRKRLLTDHDKKVIRGEGVAKLSSLPIKMLDKGRISLKDIRSGILASGCQVVFVDYLQRCKLPSGDRESSQLYEFMAEYKEILLATGTVGFIACQLDRERDTRSADKPTLRDFRGSSGIESESDTAILLWKPGAKDTQQPQFIPPAAEHIRIIAEVAKARNGVAGKGIDFDFRGDTVRFIESRVRA